MHFIMNKTSFSIFLLLVFSLFLIPTLSATQMKYTVGTQSQSSPTAEGSAIPE